VFSVDLFHLSVGVVDLLHQVGEFINGGSLFFENAKTKFNHSVDAVSEGDGVYKGETGCQQIDVVQGPHKVFEGLVALVDLSLVAELVDDLIFGIDFPGLIAEHVAGYRVVTEILVLHDALHSGSPAVFGGDQDAGIFVNTGANDDLLNLVFGVL
jgi:hypothetical protein